MIKLCLIAPVPPPYGGIGNWVLLIKRFIESRNDITVHVVNTAPVQRSIDGRSIWERIVVQGMQIFKIRRELVETTAKNKPDIIHITTSGQLAVLRDIILLRTAKKKSIMTVYHIHFGRIREIAEKNTIEWKLICKAMSVASKVMVIDKSSLEAINKSIPIVKTIYVPNPIDINTIPKPINNDQKTVMFLGWIVKSKGIEELLTAWENVSIIHSDWTLKLVGPCNNSYFEYLKSNFTLNNVIFESEKHHDEAMRILSESGILVLPSYTEGFPNVILEAMALKIPIVATNVGAIPDMLSNECGILIKTRDTSEIEKALEELISNSDKRNNLRNNAYKKLISEYTIEKVFSSYMQAWGILRY